MSIHSFLLIHVKPNNRIPAFLVVTNQFVCKRIQVLISLKNYTRTVKKMRIVNRKPLKRYQDCIYNILAILFDDMVVHRSTQW